MSNLVFDPEQYELRGTLPETYTNNQKLLLSRTISRVQGQLDWNAQMLGFSGPNYWGNQSFDSEGNYRWVGLPETAFEKRSLQVGSFGVYHKNLPYEQRPFPFNRSKVNTSADQTFSIEEDFGKTIIYAFGQTKDIEYKNSPYLYQGAVYTFDKLIEVLEEGEGVYVTQDKEQEITQVEIFSEEVTTISVRLENSLADYFVFFVIPWQDTSDWRSDQVLESYLGLWGNKGNELPLHFSFDALNLHGFDESEGLQLEKVKETFSLNSLLAKVGLSPTITTYLSNTNFRFWVEGCEEYFQPELSLETKIIGIQTEDYTNLLTENNDQFSLDDGECISQEFTVFETDGEEENTGTFDNGDFDDSGVILGELNNGIYPFSEPPTFTVSDGGFSFNTPFQITTESDDLLAQNQFEVDVRPCFSIPDPKFGECNQPNFKIEFFQNLDQTDLLIGPDPGSEISVPIGCNGVSGLDPIGCGVDNNLFDFSGVPEFLIDNGTLENIGQIQNNIFNGFYDQDPRSLCERDFDPERSIDLDSLVIDVGGQAGPVLYTDLGVETELSFAGYDPVIGEFELVFDGLRLNSFDITYESFTDSGKIDFPIVEWEIDLDLNNGVYYPSNSMYPVASADDGEYGTAMGVNEGYVWDEGVYDQNPEVLIVDQGILNQDLSNCRIDNGVLIYGQNPPSYSSTIDGNGSVNLEVNCVTYDNGLRFDAEFVASCELDNGSEFDSISVEVVDEGNYDKGILQCEPCGPLDDSLNSVPALIRTQITKELFDSAVWKLYPSVKNSASPLRVWKNRTLVTESNLIADFNNGPEPVADSNYHIRLPIEYPRGSKFWNRTEKICKNFGYFGQSLTNTLVKDPVIPRRPNLYGESSIYDSDEVLVYHEPYLTSSVETDTLQSQQGFTDSRISQDDDYLDFTSASITNYDPFDHRVPKIDGNWKGDYFYLLNNQVTGHLEEDILRQNLVAIPESQYPVWDLSPLIYPEISPPELEVGKIIKGHTVSYAYFVADFSASDEAIFDPQTPYCYRGEVIEGKITSGDDFGITTENEILIIDDNLLVAETKKPTRTAYLIHD